jgi:transposase-like protein
MDTFDDEKHEEQKESVGRSRAHGEKRKRAGGARATCGGQGCKKRLTAKHKHLLDGARVCGACWQKYYTARHSPPAPRSSSSSSAAASSSSRLYATRSVIPAIPTSRSFSTHDWQIHQRSEDSEGLAAQWLAINADPRSTAFSRTLIEGNPHHTQWSALTARHDWRDVEKLATRTELIARAACQAVMGARAAMLTHTHLAAIKVLTSQVGHGLQHYRFDCANAAQARKKISVLLFCGDTMSTEFPLHTAETMRPAFISGVVATQSEHEAISMLVREEHFLSFHVKAGDMAVFMGDVCHREINNSGPLPRTVLYLHFSPTRERHQDLQQRVPIELPMFAPLTHERRHFIIGFNLIGMTEEAIALAVGCSRKTVHHWINQHREVGHVEDKPRSGRPKIETPDFAAEARAQPFASTPRMLRAKLRAPVSKRTIRRRLNDDQLFGRVSRHFFKLKPDHIRARISFAEGYRNWTADKWMTVLFSDEKIFTLGLHGRVWVQRPPNSAWKTEYVREAESHPAGVNFWCCFGGRGTGGCETFSYKNTGVVMRGILNHHLLISAGKLFHQRPPEPWWFLWDNSPIHKSREVQDWLHNHGVSMMELPPYSPDLNPTEHLLADMARRVEQRFPSTVDELEEAIHIEWPLTDLSFLSQLARSMPHRIEAVLRNQGHATKY